MYSAEERLAEVIRLLEKMPVQQASSDRQPWAKIHMSDFVKIIEVAKGETHPSEWVSHPCGVNMAGHKFDHSPHWWNDYVDRRDPLRMYYWCDGTLPFTFPSESDTVKP